MVVLREKNGREADRCLHFRPLLFLFIRQGAAHDGERSPELTRLLLRAIAGGAPYGAPPPAIRHRVGRARRRRPRPRASCAAPCRGRSPRWRVSTLPSGPWRLLRAARPARLLR